MSKHKVWSKIEILNFGIKNDWFGYFWAGKWKEYYHIRILKNDCHIWNHHPRICLIVNFCEETKMFKFGTKNALFGVFWDGTWKQYVMFEISTFESSYLQIFGNVLFGYFWARILKSYCHIWNQHLQIWQESLSHTMNFGIGSAFSKGPRSTFSEGPGLDPGSLYKMCPSF